MLWVETKYDSIGGFEFKLVHGPIKKFRLLHFLDESGR